MKTILLYNFLFKFEHTLKRSHSDTVFQSRWSIRKSMWWLSYILSPEQILGNHHFFFSQMPWSEMEFLMLTLNALMSHFPDADQQALITMALYASTELLTLKGIFWGKSRITNLLFSLCCSKVPHACSYASSWQPWATWLGVEYPFNSVPVLLHSSLDNFSFPQGEAVDAVLHTCQNWGPKPIASHCDDLQQIGMLSLPTCKSYFSWKTESLSLHIVMAASGKSPVFPPFVLQ